MSSTVTSDAGPDLVVVLRDRQPSTERRSRRTGKLPRGVYNAQRERADARYAAAMEETRRELADEMFGPDTNCVARLRLSKGLSQMQLAAAAHITQPHLAKIEGGKLSIRLSTAVQLADALGVKVDELRPLVDISSDNAPSIGTV